MWKKIVSLNLVLLLIVAMLPIGTISAAAATGDSKTVTFHYLTWGNEWNTTTWTTNDVTITEGDWYYQGASDVYTNVFRGWNSAEDGTGTIYPISGTADDLPDNLYAQYDKQPDENYVILDTTNANCTLTTGYTRGAMAFENDGTVTLPGTTQVGIDSSEVAYWYASSDAETDIIYYEPNKALTIASNTILYPLLKTQLAGRSTPVTMHYCGTWCSAQDSTGNTINYTEWYAQSLIFFYNGNNISYYNYDANDYSGKLNSAADGTGTSYNYRGEASNIPDGTTDLYVDNYTPTTDYVILDTSRTSYTRRVGYTTASNGTITLPSTVNGNNITFWYTEDCTVYDPGEYTVGASGTLASGTRLYAFINNNYNSTSTNTVLYFYKAADGTWTPELATVNDYGWCSLYSNSPSGEVLVGYNTKKDGTGDKYSTSGRDLPSPLYAQYETPTTQNYVILKSNDSDYKFNNGYSIKCVDLDSDGKITLPSTINSTNVVYWYSWNYNYETYQGTSTYYLPGEPVTIASGTTLFARVEDDYWYYAVFDGGEGTTETGTPYYVAEHLKTSPADLTTYADISSKFSLAGNAIVGFTDADNTPYSLSDYVFEKVNDPASFTAGVSKLTTEYVDVSGNYIIYSGNGATTSDGKSYSIQDDLSGSSTYVEGSVFAAPDGKEFYGWSTEKDGSGQSWYSVGDAVDLSSGTVLFAQWKDVNGSTNPTDPTDPTAPTPVGAKIVRFHYLDDDGTTWETMEQTIIDSVQYEYIAPDIPGKVFTGWNTDKDGKETNYVCNGFPSNMPDDLYAQYADVSGKSYVILDATRLIFALDNNGNQRNISELGSDGKVTLPTQIYFDNELTNVGRWYSSVEGEIHYYNPGDTVELESGTILFPLLEREMGGRDEPITLHYNSSFGYYDGNGNWVSAIEQWAEPLLFHTDSNNEWQYVGNPTDVIGWTDEEDGTVVKYETEGPESDLPDDLTDLYAVYDTQTTTSTPTVSTPTTTTPATNTTTTTNSDGSTTTTTTDSSTGAVTETTTATNGVTGTTVKDKEGNVTSVSASVPAEAVKKDEAVTLPVEVAAAATTEKATAVEISVPTSAGTVKVEIPTTNATAATVAVKVNADGTETIIKTSAATENGVAIDVSGDVTIKIIDNTKTFDDVDDSYWGNDAITFATARGILNGTGSGTFDPKSNMNRGMVAQMLFNLADATAGDASKTFTDVADGKWYTDAIVWAAGTGIVQGNADGSFNPTGDVTREALIVMLWRYADSPTSTNTELAFGDASSVSSWAQQAMLWATENGIVQGNTDGSLNPKGSATRTEVATIIMNYLNAR